MSELPADASAAPTRRIAILGNSGSGKSTLAAQLAKRCAGVALDLDTLVWEPDPVAVARPARAVRDDLESFCARHPAWVVEGCYGDLIAATLGWSPLLLFLNPGEQACIEHCRARPWEPHKYASRAEQDARLAFLLEWVAGYYRRDDALSLRGHRAVFEAYAGPRRELTDPLRYLDEVCAAFLS